MLGRVVANLGTDKRGTPRVWLEGARLAGAGFAPSARYAVSFDAANRSVVLELASDGGRMVSMRRRGDSSPVPIVDLAVGKVGETLGGIERISIRFEPGRIVVTPAPSEVRRLAREARLRAAAAEGRPLRCGSVSTGLGVLALAIHQGLEDAGMPSELAFSVEIDERYQDVCAERNPVWSPGTTAMAMPMQEVAYDASSLARLGEVDILEAGIPCTAHSPAGRAKKGLSRPEDDETSGHLAAPFLAIVAATNPAVLIVENVPQYMTSASFSIITTQLREWGYDVDAAVLRGRDFGCLEKRDRMALVATTPGVSVDLASLAPARPAHGRLGDVLEDVPEYDRRWSTMAHLREKEVRDAAAGKGFAMQTYGPEDRAVSTIGRGYAKIRSTEPKIRHPSNPELLRQLTPAEHARIKGVPTSIVDGLPETIAHELLGQSVLAAPFRALGRALGTAIAGMAPVKAAENDDLPLFGLFAA